MVSCMRQNVTGQSGRRIPQSPAVNLAKQHHLQPGCVISGALLPTNAREIEELLVLIKAH